MPSTPRRLQDLAPGLQSHAAGYWVAPDATAVPYPDSAHDFFLTLEEESFWFAHRNRAIAAAVLRYPPVDGPIFDVGAGNGYVAAALQDCGFRTVAIEPNQTGAANAVRRGVEHVVCGSLPSEAFGLHTAGAIGLFDVLEHVEQDREFLQALRPYLKPGGRLYVTAPAYQWLWSDNDAFSQHCRRYTCERLAAVLNAAGYRVEYATYIFWCLPLPVFVLRTIGSRLRRRPRQAFTSAAEHRIGSPGLRRMAERSFAFEITRIARGASMPFGGSCLMVGQAGN